MSASKVEHRTDELFAEQRDAVFRRTSHMFALLMVAQWLFAIILALVYSPYGWEGKERNIHAHVWIAVFGGGLIASLPLYLARTRPSDTTTRHVIAVAQMMWSAMLIHLTAGRIETHFHVFGSLAFVAFYRDWKVLLPATVVVATDHLARQMFWPESVYGELHPEWWRFIEHAFWVVFEDIVLIMGCIVFTEELRRSARARADVEALSHSEAEKSRALQQALDDLEASQGSLVKAEKLAAVGQLAASVGHELRNPLAAVRNASTYVSRRVRDGKADDPKVEKFLDLIDRELNVCSKIIGDLLDFARERPLVLTPTPLKALADEAIGLLPASTAVVVNEIPADLAIPRVDKDQFRQIMVNLIQNAVEASDGAVPDGGVARVVIGAERRGRAWRMTITDNGPGIPADLLARMFEPLFTTKVKGTGLGLAIVAGIVKRHQGSVWVDSPPGQGTTFTIEWGGEAREPAAAPPEPAAAQAVTP